MSNSHSRLPAPQCCTGISLDEVLPLRRRHRRLVGFLETGGEALAAALLIEVASAESWADRSLRALHTGEPRVCDVVSVVCWHTSIASANNDPRAEGSQGKS